MAFGVNKAFIIGHVGKDPDIRRTQDGKVIANFSVATSTGWRDRNGEKQEKTTWHRVVVFNEALAKVVEQYVHKGSRIYVEGSMQTRKWTDNGGIDRYVTEIVVGPFNSAITLLDKREGGGGAPAGSEYPEEYTARGGAPATTTQPANKDAFIDDEIPFLKFAAPGRFGRRSR